MTKDEYKAFSSAYRTMRKKGKYFIRKLPYSHIFDIAIIKWLYQDNLQMRADFLNWREPLRKWACFTNGYRFVHETYPITRK